MFLQIKSFNEVDEALGIFTAYANVKFFKDHAKDVTVDGAFIKSINERKAKGRLPKMLLQHDYREVVGVWLEMDEDEKGLRVKGQLCMETQKGRDTYHLMKIGALDALSIGYIVKKQRFDPETNTNYLEELDIREVSIVTFPCNEESLIDSVKSEQSETVESISVDSVDISEEVEEKEETASEETLNSTSTEESEVETSEEEIIEEENEIVISPEVMEKLDHLVLAIKLSKIV
ncbi:HK97 family phage prohead protease [Vibrio vulnificus]|uniref:HK97 family phage prohead protease n=1 Tax=Vibrio vulnificus TaxID=672 RepID=UPI0032425D38